MSFKLEQFSCRKDTIALLAAELHALLEDAVFVRAFAISKLQLYLYFRKEGQLTRLSFVTGPELTALFAEEAEDDTHDGPRRPLFDAVAGMQVLQVGHHQDERMLGIRFSSQTLIVFQLFGRNGNAVLYDEGQPVEWLRTTLTGSSPASADELPPLLLGEANQKELALGTNNQGELAIEDDVGALRETKLQSKSINLLLHRYVQAYLAQRRFATLKKQLLEAAEQKINQLEKLLKSVRTELENLPTAEQLAQQADVVMSNLHAIGQNAREATLYDFYQNREVLFRFGDLGPLKTAEKQYAQAKTINQRRQQLEEKLKEAEDKLPAEYERLRVIEQAENLKELKPFAKGGKAKKQQEAIPFRHFQVEGWDIYVGKGAASNDMLTVKFAHKDDLWLHARGASGSHVVVRHRKGKPFPPAVKEAAAAVAAYYSKARGSDMAPVAYTLKKYVRKPKGAAPGAVLMEREEVVMVKPGLPKN